MTEEEVIRRMTEKEVIKTVKIAEDFDEWLEDMAEKYGCLKDDVQALIERFLM